MPSHNMVANSQFLAGRENRFYDFEADVTQRPLVGLEPTLCLHKCQMLDLLEVHPQIRSCGTIGGLGQLRALLKAAISTSITAPVAPAKHHYNFGNREATTRALIGVLGIDSLIFGSITHQQSHHIFSHAFRTTSLVARLKFGVQ